MHLGPQEEYKSHVNSMRALQSAIKNGDRTRQLPEIWCVISILGVLQKCHELKMIDLQFQKHMWEIPLGAKVLGLALWKEADLCQNKFHSSDPVK